jgi:hypothetical protein
MRKIQKEIFKKYKELSSWEKCKEFFNAKYGVNISKAAYSQWITKGIEPADEAVRSAFGLGARLCPTCKHRMTKIDTVKVSRQIDPVEHWWRNILSKHERKAFMDAAAKSAGVI